MGFRLRVLEYGKIKSAEIEAAPLTLFVGDNNSGKSYLMSLLWGIRNFGAEVLLGNAFESMTEPENRLLGWVREHVEKAQEQGKCTADVGKIARELQLVLQESVNRNKNKLLKTIFNSSDVKIKELQIELTDLDKASISFSFDVSGSSSEIYLKMGESDYVYGIVLSKGDQKAGRLSDENQYFLIRALFDLLFNNGCDDWEFNKCIYLPAARTGFMLTKDVINKFGRRETFNIGAEREAVAPFVRPINQFLDVINDLVLDGAGNEKFADIINYLERDMADGTVKMSTLPNKEVLYVPKGKRFGIPLRIVSAVVTELSPLILILKHKDKLDTIFYEEPEMCLHPQLQQKMARVICRLVNAGVDMGVTTHSDIILQHVNNMIRLSHRKDREEICRQLGYTADDLLTPDQVKVYQLKAEAGGKTSVEELPCGEYGYKVPTFNDALDRIMDEAYTIQE